YLVSRLFCIEAHLDLDAQFLESLFQVHVNHLRAWHGVEVVAVPPCEHAQLSAREVHSPGWAIPERQLRAVVVNGDGGLVTVLHCPDDVLRAPGRITAEENAGQRGLERGLVHNRHVPFSELHADVTLYPRECILLSYRENHVVAGNDYRARHFTSLAAFHLCPREALELHSDKFAVLDNEAAG